MFFTKSCLLVAFSGICDDTGLQKALLRVDSLGPTQGWDATAILRDLFFHVQHGQFGWNFKDIYLFGFTWDVIMGKIWSERLKNARGSKLEKRKGKSQRWDRPKNAAYTVLKQSKHQNPTSTEKITFCRQPLDGLLSHPGRNWCVEALRFDTKIATSVAGITHNSVLD